MQCGEVRKCTEMYGGREHTTVCDRVNEGEGSPFYAHKPQPEPANYCGIRILGAAGKGREHTKKYVTDLIPAGVPALLPARGRRSKKKARSSVM